MTKEKEKKKRFKEKRKCYPIGFGYNEYVMKISLVLRAKLASFTRRF